MATNFCFLVANAAIRASRISSTFEEESGIDMIMLLIYISVSSVSRLCRIKQLIEEINKSPKPYAKLFRDLKLK